MARTGTLHGADGVAASRPPRDDAIWLLLLHSPEWQWPLFPRMADTKALVLSPDKTSSDVENHVPAAASPDGWSGCAGTDRDGCMVDDDAGVVAAWAAPDCQQSHEPAVQR
jgi:hypothetical protein